MLIELVGHLPLHSTKDMGKHYRKLNLGKLCSKRKAEVEMRNDQEKIFGG